MTRKSKWTIPGPTIGPVRLDRKYLFLFRDEFVTDRAAGAVNGTLPEPKGLNRKVGDVESKILIASGWVEFTPQATPVYAEQDLVYNLDPITRANGVLLLGKFRVTTDGSFYPLALVTSQTPTWNPTHIEAAFHRAATALSLTATYNATAGPIIATFVADGTVYRLCITADDAAGYKFYIKGGAYTNWTLVYRTVTGATATLYAAIAGYSAAFGADFIRDPVAVILSNPLLSDTFAGTWPIPDVIGGPWLDAGTWATAAGVVANTPVVGIERLVNGNMELDSGWANQYTPDTNERSATQAQEGTYSRRIVEASATTVGAISGVMALGIGSWISLSGWMYKVSGVNPRIMLWNTSGTTLASATIGAWVKDQGTVRSIVANDQIVLLNDSAAAFEAYFDNISVKIMPTSTLLTNLQLSTNDVLVEQVISAYTLKTQCGIVLNADRSFAAKCAAPAAAGQAVIALKEVTGVGGVGLAVTDGITVNGVVYTIASVTGGSNVAYNDVAKTQTVTLGANLGAQVLTDAKVGLDWKAWNGVLLYFGGIGTIKLDEVVAGVYTNRGNTTKAFAADARLIASKIGTEYRWFYNEALIATTTAVDAAAMAGKYHGMFSTAVDNTITSMVVYPTGTGGEHSILDRFSKD